MKNMVRQAHHDKRCHPELVEGSHRTTEFRRIASSFLLPLSTLCPLWLTVVFLVILAFSLTPAASEEARWKMIGKSKTDTLWYIDTETLSRVPGNIVSVWLKTVPAKAATDFLEGEESIESILKKIQARSFGDYEYTEGLWELDCSGERSRLLYFAAFNKQDKVITSSLTPDAEWSLIVCGSISETMHEKLCGH